MCCFLWLRPQRVSIPLAVLRSRTRIATAVSAPRPRQKRTVPLVMEKLYRHSRDRDGGHHRSVTPSCRRERVQWEPLVKGQRSIPVRIDSHTDSERSTNARSLSGFSTIQNRVTCCPSNPKSRTPHTPADEYARLAVDLWHRHQRVHRAVVFGRQSQEEPGHPVLAGHRPLGSRHPATSVRQGGGVMDQQLHQLAGRRAGRRRQMPGPADPCLPPQPPFGPDGPVAPYGRGGKAIGSWPRSLPRQRRSP